MDHYRYTRHEALEQLYQYCAKDSTVRMELVSAIFLDSKPTDQDLAWVFQKARQHKMIDLCMPTDPVLAQQLAMDT